MKYKVQCNPDSSDRFSNFTKLGMEFVCTCRSCQQAGLYAVLDEHGTQVGNVHPQEFTLLKWLPGEQPKLKENVTDFRKRLKPLITNSLVKVGIPMINADSSAASHEYKLAD